MEPRRLCLRPGKESGSSASPPEARPRLLSFISSIPVWLYAWKHRDALYDPWLKTLPTHRSCAHLLDPSAFSIPQSSLSVTLGPGTLSLGRNARMLLWSTLQPSQGGSTHPQLPSRTILGHGHWHQGPLPHASLQLLPALRGTWPPAGPDRLPLSPPTQSMQGTLLQAGVLGWSWAKEVCLIASINFPGRQVF